MVSLRRPPQGIDLSKNIAQAIHNHPFCDTYAHAINEDSYPREMGEKLII
jgi:hypothetical protein